AKKQRFKPNENELNLLMSFFESNPFPDRTQRGQLAIQLGLEPKQILFWFQNRR
ncbi:homeobox domain-containing protein, partial [Chytriomyces cf. hyalinus JEL632]